MQRLLSKLLVVIALAKLSACGSSDTASTSSLPPVVFPSAPGAGTGNVDAAMFRGSLLADSEFERNIRSGVATPVSPTTGSATFLGYVSWDSINPAAPPQTRTVGNLTVDVQFDTGSVLSTVDGFRSVTPGMTAGAGVLPVWSQLVGIGSVSGSTVSSGLNGSATVPGAGIFPATFNLSGSMYRNGPGTYVGGIVTGGPSLAGGTPTFVANGDFFATD